MDTGKVRALGPDATLSAQALKRARKESDRDTPRRSFGAELEEKSRDSRRPALTSHDEANSEDSRVSLPEVGEAGSQIDVVG